MDKSSYYRSHLGYFFKKTFVIQFKYTIYNTICCAFLLAKSLFELSILFENTNFFHVFACMFCFKLGIIDSFGKFKWFFGPIGKTVMQQSLFCIEFLMPLQSYKMYIFVCI